MKIKVDRTNTFEQELVFTITVKNPHLVPFNEEEINCINFFETMEKSLKLKLGSTSKMLHDIVESNQKLKQKLFTRIIDNLKFSIENELRVKFRPICQEIYNWIYDFQEGYIKKFLLEFDPQRSKYYFDNDINVAEMPSDQESEHEFEDDFDDEDEDEDEDEE